MSLGKDQDEIDEEWGSLKKKDRNWQACLEIISSIRCAAPIPADIILQHNPDLAPPAPERHRQKKCGA